MSTIPAIDAAIQETMVKIAEAASSRNITALSVLTTRATELEQMKRTVENIESSLKQPNGPQAPNISRDGFRRFPIEVSQGMINQNLLTLTEHVKGGRIQSGEEMSIEARPSGDRFRTDLVNIGNKLRERSAIGKFYRDTAVRAGEFVVLTEVSRGQWTLEKAKNEEIQSFRMSQFFGPG